MSHHPTGSVGWRAFGIACAALFCMSFTGCCQGRAGSGAPAPDVAEGPGTRFVIPRKRTLFAKPLGFTGSPFYVREGSELRVSFPLEGPPRSPTPFATLVDREPCGVDMTGRAACWGKSLEAPFVLDGARFDDAAPTVLPLPERSVDVQANHGYGCAVGESGVVRCWGDNVVGQLGRATSETARVLGADWLVGRTPGLVEGVTNAVQVALEESHACARQRDGGVVCWGAAWDAADGGNRLLAKGERPPPPWRPALGAPAVQITANPLCALRVDGTVRCWGNGWDGRCGVAETADDHGGSPGVPPVVGATRLARERVLHDPGVTDVVQLATFDGTVCAVRSNGHVVCWGSDWDGRAGGQRAPLVHHNPRRFDPTGVREGWSLPHEIAGVTDVVEITLSAGPTCARRPSGNLVCWGSAPDGSLGPTFPKTGAQPPTEITLPAP